MTTPMTTSQQESGSEVTEEPVEETSSTLYWRILAGRRSIRRLPGHEVDRRYPPTVALGSLT